MPLTEFVRMLKGKVNMNQEETSHSTDHSSRPHADCLELVLEDGQIMTQGKGRRNYMSNNFQTFGLRPQDGSRNGNGSRMTKFGTMDSLMGDFPLSDPSCGMGLDQDVDLVPWLSFPMDEPEPEPQPLHNDFTPDFLHELSGVTINNLSLENNTTFRERKSSFHHGDSHDASASLKHDNTSRAFSSNEKDNRGGSSEVPQHLLPFQNSTPRSDFSDITGNNSGNVHRIASQDSILNPSSLSAFTSLKLQKLDAGQSNTTSSGFTNFPCFSRPASFSRANHMSVNPSKIFKSDDRRSTFTNSNPTHSTLVNLESGFSQKEIVSQNQSNMAPAIGNSEALPARPAEELPSANQPKCREDNAKFHVSQNQACDAANGDKNVDPVVAASSVCSGNSAERASNEPANDLKRKSRETADSDGPSDEVEEESVGAKKTLHGRNGSKRSRAAEVHNLSERRRRDRINEKMRSLQELIPNCNKADKASMLDEAIEYLKTLQLQVQMLSMGAGMYMHPMMLPPGMQPIHGAHMPQFSPMGLGMGMGMGFGMNMLNINNGTNMVPFQGPHYPVPGTGPSFQGMPVPNLQTFAHPGQGLPMPMQQAPIPPVPMSGSHLKTPVGLNVSGVSGSSNVPHLASSSSKKDANPQVIPSMAGNNITSAVNQTTNQASNEGIQQTANRQDQPQDVNISEVAETASRKDDMRS